MIHEILHAYLLSENFAESNSQQHQAMVTNYIGWHKSALQEIFPNMSDNEAHSIA